MDLIEYIHVDRIVKSEFKLMSREKKITPENAIKAALTLFWQYGYNQLGTRQLEQETGITRFTLQTSYGGKMSLFLTALDAYLDTFETHAAPKMTDGKLENLAKWFEMRPSPPIFIEISSQGCFLLNTAIEFSSTNAEVNKRIERFYGIVRSGLTNALTAIKQNQAVADDFDVEAMTEALLGATIGLNVVIRAAGDNAAGQKMADGMGKLIREWAIDG